MNTLILIGSFNAFFFSILLLKKKNRWYHDNILVYWLILLGLYTGIYGLTSRFLFHDYPFISVVLVSLIMLLGPLYYLYVKTLSTGLKPGIFDLKHFIPFTLFELYLLTCFVRQDISGISLSHTVDQPFMPGLFIFFLILTSISGPVYFLLSIKLYKKLSSTISNNFSSEKQVDPAWLRTLSLIFGIIWTLLITVAVIHHVAGLFSLSFCTDGLALSLSILIILLGYFGIQQKGIFVGNDTNVQPYITEPLKKYSSSGLKEEEAVMLTEKLLAYMNIKKPWLDPEITLPKLAEELCISSHHLSRVINENLQSNFFDLMNKQRVKEVINKINDPDYQNYSLLGIAFESGFNSKTAFNRLFKKYTGLTPSAYKTSETDLTISNW